MWHEYAIKYLIYVRCETIRSDEYDVQRLLVVEMNTPEWYTKNSIRDSHSELVGWYCQKNYNCISVLPCKDETKPPFGYWKTELPKVDKEEFL